MCVSPIAGIVQSSAPVRTFCAELDSILGVEGGGLPRGALIGMYGQGGFPIFAEQKKPYFFLACSQKIAARPERGRPSSDYQVRPIQ